MIMAVTLTTSVGKAGCNTNLGENIAVQMLLNKFIIPGCLGSLKALILDGSIGGKTIAAIEKFQSGIMGHKSPDGRVDPAGATLAALNGPLKWVQKPSGISNSDYIRWVKASLNRLLGCELPDNASIAPEYRMWVMAFQTNQKLAVTSSVDEATQNALIKRNRQYGEYVLWIQIALTISGEGIGTGGKAISTKGFWNSETQEAVKDFQINHEGGLVVDGFVGAKTETALMARTNTTPPGRPGAKRVLPPGVWDNLLTDQDRVELFGKMYKTELDGKAQGVREEQMSCFAGKLSSMSRPHDYQFLSFIDVDHFSKAVLPKSGTKTMREIVEEHARSNAMEEIMGAMTPLLKSSSFRGAYEKYKKEIEKVYLRVREGLREIEWRSASDPRYAYNEPLKLMLVWAQELQKSQFHIYSCFQDIGG
jgi:peptidoglycan hydrolase-like protein with peptidoglycan-binding domain